jgi:hypothetical protein
MAREIDRITPILTYLRKNLTKGYKPESLKWALINEGYSRIEVEKGMKQVQEELAKEMQIAESKALKETEAQASIISDEMPQQVESPGFFSKVKGWFS